MSERFVYVIEAVKTPFVKVGQSKSIEGVYKRVRSAQTYCPYELRLFATFKCNAGDAAVHLWLETLKIPRIRNEWFKAKPDVLVKRLTEFILSEKSLQYALTTLDWLSLPVIIERNKSVA